MPASPARWAAFQILLRVEEGAYADELLHSRRLDDLSARDRALATELTLGVLRWQGALDMLIVQPAKRRIENLDPEVRCALRLGAYQMRFLSKIPDRAAVSESVDLVKEARRLSASGFVNAVLRKLPERKPGAAENQQTHPRWMVDRWWARYGSEKTDELLTAFLEPPPTYLRLSARYPFGETLALLAEEDVRAEATETAGAYRLLEGAPQKGRCWAEGRIRIQDLGSQQVVPLLGPSKDKTLLDLCAAPGGKTQHAIELRGGADGVIACDYRHRRLRRMRELAVEPPPLAVVDASKALPFRGRFDQILIDAPCSGTGTLGRNPEIKWRLQPDDIADLQWRQKNILLHGLDCLAPGGALVYSTCSIEAEENDHVVQAVLRRRPNYRVAERMLKLPGVGAGDGFFAVRLEERS